jgi:hypothetical protein
VHSVNWPGTASYRVAPARAGGYTLLGSPTVIARLDVTGAKPNDAQLAARLWDLAPDGSEVLVARSLYRPRDGRQVFQLHPGAYHFARGHVAKLELLGNDAPYGRASNLPFDIAVSDLRLRLPVAESPDGAQIRAPAAHVLPNGATPAPGT